MSIRRLLAPIAMLAMTEMAPRALYFARVLAWFLPCADNLGIHRYDAEMVLSAALLLLALGTSPAPTQSPTAGTPALVYGVFGGPGRRTTTGTFLIPALPTGASQPASDRTTVTLGFNAGVQLTSHVALLAVIDQTAGGNLSAGHWGTMRMHAVGRVWFTRRLWAEAGGGLSELGHKKPSLTGTGVTRFWAPGAEASIGADVLKGPHVALTISARYSTAVFNQLEIRSVAFQVGLFSRR